ncbi:MAG TPA: tetratricopeptide repeat protein [Dokdonella sp.]
MRNPDEVAVSAARNELSQVNASLRRGEFDHAEALLADAARVLPDDAETLRLQGLVHHLRGRLGDALILLRAAHSRWPAHAGILNTLGGALRDAGDGEGAIAALRKSCELDPDAAASWYNLGVALVSHGRNEEAAAVFARALDIDPAHLAAQLAHADTLARLQQPAQAAAHYRATLQSHPGNARAQIGLADVDAASLSAGEFAALQALSCESALAEGERVAAQFAFAHALEARGDVDAAFAAFASANAVRHRQLNWNGAQFSQLVDQVADAFAQPAATNPDANSGNDIVLLVGWPGDGADRLSAALAAHPDVSVGNGAPELANVIQEESTRRGEAFPVWVASATAGDWQRLGQRYLQRSARWRRPHALHVDPALPNWPFLGAFFSMLPGARVIDMRGDAVETCWACYRRSFPRSREAYAYDFADLAAHWHDHERLMLYWHARHARRIYQQDGARLAAEPTAAIRGLLEFCALPFEAECAKKAAAVPAVVSAKVYGRHLDPLRRLLDPFAR